MGRDIAELVASMTVDERASLTAGSGLWSTAAVERVGIPRIHVTDGPAGARGPFVPGIGAQVKTLNIPCGSALGATWNPDLVEELGEALGDQARTKACRVLLAPTVNLHRAPLAGRNFEAYSEDPHLTGMLAAAFVRGVQSQGVATTVKHFAGNESEHERMTIDTVVDQRTLRELYLLPFEMAVRDGGALGVMTSYNRLNGTYNTESATMLQTILRDEWGFEGFVVSDWFAGGSTTGAAAAGLDLEMPGPPRFYGRLLGQAVDEGGVDERLLDAAVVRLLTVFDRTGALDDEPREPIAIDRAEHRVLARRAATESMVLLKNDGVLPFDLSRITTLAVVGPNAERARIMGGGSAEVEPHYRISPLDAFRAHLGAGVTVVHEPGCDIDKTVPILASAHLVGRNGRPGFTIEMFEGLRWQGEVVATATCPDGRVIVLPESQPGVPSGPMSFRATATYSPGRGGPHVLSMIELGRGRLLLDGAVVFDGIETPTPRGDAFFGLAGCELTAQVELPAEGAVELTIEFTSVASAWLQGVQLGCKEVLAQDAIQRAVDVAARADAVVVIVGTNDDWETEGHDRADLHLPGAQGELIERVSAANPNTAVVVNAGAPVTTSWASATPAVLLTWFGGQEMANAMTDVLFGVAEPSGRLATTFPARIEDTPSFGNFPGEHGQVRYGEGVLMGYRWYEARRIGVPFAFGHGLSYTRCSIGPPRVTDNIDGDGTGAIHVTCEVINRGDRRGAEVVQCYVGAVATAVVRPPKELKAFRKVWLDPGESTTVTFDLDARAFSYWDPGSSYKGSVVPHAAGPWTATELVEAGWRIDGGDHLLHVGRASDDIAHVVSVTVSSGRPA